MMAAKTTTIPLSPRVRDRLKTFGTMNDTYDSILERMMDNIERDHFVEQMRREIDNPNTTWVNLEDLEWGA